VGDPKFTVWFNDVYQNGHYKARVTHGRDPVPHLPMKDWGFLHLNNEVFYKGTLKAGPHMCKDATDEDKNCSNQYLVDVNILDHISYYDIDFTGIMLACQ
jgi:hypothetical protein